MRINRLPVTNIVKRPVQMPLALETPEARKELTEQKSSNTAPAPVQQASVDCDRLANKCAPSFLILGVPRGGTSSLYEYLAQHPFVHRAQHREVRFFSDTEKRDFRSTAAWYASRFPDVFPPNITGESTPTYFSEKVADQVKEMLPNVKMIVLLRDPVDRFESHFYSVRQQENPDTFVTSAIARYECERFNNCTKKPFNPDGLRYLKYGLYAEQLEHWWQYFEDNQLMIIKSEEFFTDTENQFMNVVNFLGLPRYMLPESLAFQKHNSRSKIHLTEAVREKLREFYKPHNERLFELLDSRWEDWEQPAKNKR